MKMLWLDIPELLIAKGVVSHVTAANATQGYALRWMQGIPIDFSKSAPNMHRARLRKLGIDIKKPYCGEFYTEEESRAIMARRFADKAAGG